MPRAGARFGKSIPLTSVGHRVQAEIPDVPRKYYLPVTEAIKTVRTMTPALSDLNLPFASKLPKPEELAGHAYSIAMKVLADQRKFAEDVLHTTAQLLPSSSGTSAKKTAAPHKTGTSASGTAKKTGSA